MVVEMVVEDTETPEAISRAAGRQFVLASCVYSSTLADVVSGDKAALRETIMTEIERNSAYGPSAYGKTARGSRAGRATAGLRTLTPFRPKHFSFRARAGMGPYYEAVCKRLGWPVDATLLEKYRCVRRRRAPPARAVRPSGGSPGRAPSREPPPSPSPLPLSTRRRKANEAELAKLDAAIKDAKENQGDVEVADAMIKKAAYFGQIGDKVSEWERERGRQRGTAPFLTTSLPPPPTCAGQVRRGVR
jgi:hypothetical protein